MNKLLKKLGIKGFILTSICILLIVLQVYLDLELPDYMSEITKLIQMDGSTIGEILKQGGYMLMCAGGSLLSSILVGFIASEVSSEFSYNTRKEIFNKVEDFGLEEIKEFKTSSLITRTTNDITQIEMYIAMGLQALIKAPILAFWAVSKILNKNVTWSILTGCCVLIIITTVIILMIIVLPRFEKVQKLIDKINNVTMENLLGIRVIKAFNAENYQGRRFDYLNNELTKNQLFNQRTFSVMMPVMNIVMQMLTLGIYFLGAFMIDKANIVEKIDLFSDMVVFSSYGMQVVMAFLMLAMIFMMWPRARISAKRINEVLEKEISLKDGAFNKETQEHGTIEFKNVSFKYPDADDYILQNISFKVQEGETIAFIGSTGSGKSTLINLVPRFYDATEGEILIDGVNVKDYELKTLYNKIGYVPQKAVLFTGTVKDNVSYGDNGKEKPNFTEIKKAVEIAQGKEFIERMPEKYDSHIARGGTNVSGGQKQRISIARAIARNPEIYIFDDSFSALDYKTDSQLRKELKKHTKNATSMIVAQRIGTIMNADKIIVLDEGKCVGQGTHKELLKNCDVYKEIALSQLSKEELENA